MESKNLNPTQTTMSFEENDCSVGYGDKWFIYHGQTSAAVVPASKSTATFCSQDHEDKFQQFAISSYKNPPSTYSLTTL
jgi:hypothetical protein